MSLFAFKNVYIHFLNLSKKFKLINFGNFQQKKNEQNLMTDKWRDNINNIVINKWIIRKLTENLFGKTIFTNMSYE